MRSRHYVHQVVDHAVAASDHSSKNRRPGDSSCIALLRRFPYEHSNFVSEFRDVFMLDGQISIGQNLQPLECSLRPFVHAFGLRVIHARTIVSNQVPQ